MLHSFELERGFGFPNKLVIGVDEVGRGCLAGPVVACAFVPPKKFELPHWAETVRDSKTVPLSERKKLNTLLRGFAENFSIGVSTPEEIGQLNILNATHLAMDRAVLGLRFRPDLVLVDGNSGCKSWSWNWKTLIRGDQKSFVIAAASIIAKVFRDEYMSKLDLEFPGYEFQSNVGYPTLSHRKALKKLGVTPHHRRGFRPVEEVIRSSSASQDSKPNQ